MGLNSFLSCTLTLQTLFILLAGVVMKRYAILPVSLYVILGALGLPVFYSGVTGFGILLGPTGGYLIGFIFGALAVGLFYEPDPGSYKLPVFQPER